VTTIDGLAAVGDLDDLDGTVVRDITDRIVKRRPHLDHREVAFRVRDELHRRRNDRVQLYVSVFVERAVLGALAPSPLS
jgi:hypothetical protein